MPMWAILWVGIEIVSTPFSLTEPVRRPTRPSTDLSVEVRPAPLRPSNVTTSPLFTTRFTPCRMWLSPYQACRFSMRRTSAMGRPHVRLDHRGMLRDLRVRPFGQHRAAREHRDGVADARDDTHVVLHHQHGAADGDFLDQ